MSRDDFLFSKEKQKNTRTNPLWDPRLPPKLIRNQESGKGREATYPGGPPNKKLAVGKEKNCIKR